MVWIMAISITGSTRQILKNQSWFQLLLEMDDGQKEDNVMIRATWCILEID